jgi:DNA invertase Pin-like site-specific DNA recombinase
MQLRELRQFAKRRGWTVAHEYVDRGISGSKQSRPALNQLMLDAGKRDFDVVLVWKLDRFARSLKHLVMAAEQFEGLGISFVSLRENLDPTTPMGKAMFGMIGVMAELERSLIQERVKAGLRNARAKGKRLGRPRAIVETARIDSLRASGASWRTIAKQTGLGVGTVHRIAQRSVKPKEPELPPTPAVCTWERNGVSSPPAGAPKVESVRLPTSEEAEQVRRTHLKSWRTRCDRNWINNPLESWEIPMEDQEIKQYHAQIEVYQRLLHSEYR